MRVIIEGEEWKGYWGDVGDLPNWLQVEAVWGTGRHLGGLSSRDNAKSENRGNGHGLYRKVGDNV